MLYFSQILIISLFEKQMSQSDQSQIQAHRLLISYLWTIVIDVAIILAINQYRSISIILHVILTLFVVIATWVISYPLYINYDPNFTDKDEYVRHSHGTIGFIIMLVILLQVISGTITQVNKLFRKNCHPYVIYFVNIFHKYLGYPIVIVAKVQTYLKLYTNYRKLFWILMGIEIFLVLLWLLHKLFFPTMSKTIAPLYQNLQIQKVEKLQDVNTPSPNLGIFANYIYDITPLERFHPQGYRIIDSIKDRDFDRFIYGMYATERQPLIKPHAHSFRTFDLLDSPIAKLSIAPLYEGLKENHNEFIIQQIRQISSQTKIYELILRIKDGNVSYKGYSSLSQIGRFFSLTIDETTTRLYTTVGFLHAQQEYQPFNTIFPTAKKEAFGLQLQGTEKRLNYPSSNEVSNNVVHLLMKLYPNGKLTPEIFKNPKSIKLSEERGEGLRLKDVGPGKLILVAGGTGLFPFSDLIDLLYKSQLVRKNGPSSKQIVAENTILESNPFSKFTFHLFLAVQNIQDIHPLTLKQLSQLSESPAFFKLTIKIKASLIKQGSALSRKNIMLTNKRFDEIVKEEIRRGEYSKIFVCGPPLMQEAMIKMFDEQNLQRFKYLFV